MYRLHVLRTDPPCRPPPTTPRPSARLMNIYASQPRLLRNKYRSVNGRAWDMVASRRQEKSREKTGTITFVRLPAERRTICQRAISGRPYLIARRGAFNISDDRRFIPANLRRNTRSPLIPPSFIPDWRKQTRFIAFFHPSRSNWCSLRKLLKRN